MAAAELVASFGAHKGGVRALVFSCDGSVLYSGGVDGRVRAWAAGDWQPAASPLFEPRHAAAVHGLALSGARLFSASRDGTVRVWNAADGTCEVTLAPGAGAALAVSVSDSTLAVSFAGAVLLWSSAPPFALKNTLRSIGCACGALALTADGTLLFTGGADGRVAAWRTAQDERAGVQNGSTLGTHEAAVSALALSPDGTRLFSACASGELRSWLVRRDGLGVLQTANALIASWRVPGSAGIRALASACARPGAALVFAGGDDGVARAWAPPPYTPSAGSDALAPRAQDWLLSLAVSHAGGDAQALLAAGGADSTCRIWRVGAVLLRATVPAATHAPITSLPGGAPPPPPMMPPPQADEHIFPVPLREERAAARDKLLREQDAYRARAVAFVREHQTAGAADKTQPAGALPPSGGWRGGFGLDPQQAALSRLYGPHLATQAALANAGLAPPGAYGAAQNLPAGWGGGPPPPLAPGAAWAAGTGATAQGQGPTAPTTFRH